MHRLLSLPLCPSYPTHTSQPLTHSCTCRFLDPKESASLSHSMSNPGQETKTQFLQGLESYLTSERHPRESLCLQKTKKRQVIDVLKTMPSQLYFR